MLKIIPVINNKGGVGKTTTTINVAAGLARRDRQVLLVDLDSQGSASLSLGVEHSDLSPSSADVLFGNRPIEEAIRSTDRANLDLLTGSLDLANADVRLQERQGGRYRLAEVLSKVESHYDQILIDCAPSTSILSVNALVAADAFIIPVAPTYLALEGVVSLGKTVRRVRRGIGEAAPILGMLLTLVDRDNDETVDAIGKIRKHYGGKVFDTEIRRDSKLKEAPSRSKDIFRYAPESLGARDYERVLSEIVDRLDRYGAVYNGLIERANRTAKTQPSSSSSDDSQSDEFVQGSTGHHDR